MCALSSPFSRGDSPERSEIIDTAVTSIGLFVAMLLAG
jgi:hypothetical protein